MKLNKKIQLLILTIGLFILTLFISCINKMQLDGNNKREIVIYSQCSSEEVLSDILYGVNEINYQLKKKSISVKIDKKMNLCGYLFINGAKKKKIKGALTDLELLQEVNIFFK